MPDQYGLCCGLIEASSYKSNAGEDPQSETNVLQGNNFMSPNFVIVSGRNVDRRSAIPIHSAIGDEVVEQTTQFSSASILR